MTNRLKEMGETASWRLMVSAAVEGAKKAGYSMKRQPGRGLSNVWEASKGGEMKVASIRTTRDRWIAFPPLDNGTRWKTLDDVELVIVSAVDDHENPQNVDVYLFPADVVRQRFDASYAARIENGHTVRDDFGMWVKLDAADADLPTQAGAGLAVEYPAIVRFTIDELETGTPVATEKAVAETPVAREEVNEAPAFSTVGDVLAFARSEIARLSGMSSDSIKLDLKIEA
ncbi:hypothetical protein [Flavisphingomonas formosensis]|uniref:hypothetical protein n=1 Tax=Flavisphingomonas formosensis TaxID=861534 RepID=UPI0012F97390|nr:hypothetical protein [Sphingomonas formosensis]